MSPLYATAALWVAWTVSWLIAAVWTRSTAARAPLASEIAYRLPIGLGYWLMLIGAHVRVAGVYYLVGVDRLWPRNDVLGWAMVGAALAGFAFTWWARLTLGTLWSGSITRKDDHRVVDTGPYRFVRHPIYTGLLLATLAAAIEIATVSAFVGLVLVALGYWLKARTEERFLAQQLGEAAYADYRRRTPMLAPFWPSGR